MGVIEWDGFLEVKIDDLSSEDKETLCESLAECRISSDASKREFKKVLTLAQVLLNFRGDQVEKLRVEVEEVEGKHEDTQEQLRQEIAELQQQANAGKKSRRAAEARQEAARLQRQNRELQAEIESLRKQQHKTDLMADVEEEENRAEREQRKLNKTLELQTGHISQLLADLEKVEAENAIFKDKLANVRDKLAEATEALSQSTSELTSARNLCLEFKGKCSELQAESEALRLQVSELVTQRSQLDQQLQEFRQAVDSRVDKWKILMNNKDAEITELRAKLLISQPDQTTHLQETVTALNQAITTRDVQIEELSSRLEEATNELSECATTLEQITHNKSDEESLRVWQQLQAALERERIMEGRLRETEQDASLRAQEVTNLTNELRKLELGELGLSEALAEMRELRKALGIRDIDIEKLVKANNDLQTKLDESADQIFVLRDRVGLGSEDEIDVSSVSEHREGQRRRTEALQTQVAQLEAERLSLKLQIRELQRHSHSGDTELKLETVQEEEIGAEMQALLEENESLRKGMHEILESVRSQDGTSEVKLESTCLERLLEALDARHIAGWYHPAMRLQAQLHSTQGIAAELREQLRIARDQEKIVRQQLVQTQTPVIVATAGESRSPHSSPSHVSLLQPHRQAGEWATTMQGQVHEILDLMSKLQGCMPPLASTWQEQVSQVEEKLADTSAEVEELRRHLDEGDHSVAVCAARAAYQRLAERKALRKCHSLAAAHARVSAQNLELLKKHFQREAQLAAEIAQLRETEAELKSQVNQLQISLSSSVPSEELKACQVTLESTSEKLRDTLLLQDSLGCDGETMQNLQVELQNSQTQVQNLQERLTQEKSIVKALEAQSQHIELDHQLSALAEKLVIAEQNEEASKQKSEHDSKMCNLLREQVRELEGRRQQLEMSVLSHFSVPSLALAADEVLSQIPQVDENRCVRLEEALSAAQHQVATLQSLVDTRHIELETLREQTTQLQGEGDLQATIGRMGEELLSLRLAEVETKNQIYHAQRNSAHLQSRCLHLEHELRLAQLSSTRAAINTQNVLRRSRHKLLELCLRHRACVPLDTLELACRWLQEARVHAREVCKLKAKDDLENISPNSVQGDENSDEKSWHARCLQLRVHNHEVERKVERLKRLLAEQIQRAGKLEAHAQQLEDERLQLETHWQQELITWQLEHCYGSEEITNVVHETQTEKKKEESLVIEDIEEEKQDSEKPAESELEIDTPKPSVGESKKSSEEEIKSIEEETRVQSSLTPPSVLQNEVEALKIQLKSREELLMKLKSQLAQQTGSGQRAKLALEAMVSSLSELVSLKEAALGRARQRLREAHVEHATVARALRQQAAELRDSLAKAQAVTPSPEVSVQEGGALTRLLTQIHELEDELRVANRGAGVLAGQLRAANAEAQRWRDLAETRQARLQKLQERYEAEVEEAVSARLNKPSAWIEKGDTEAAEKDESPELLKAHQESSNLRERLSHCEEEVLSLQKQLEGTKGDGESSKKSFRENQEQRAAQEKLRAQLKQLQLELEESRAKQQATLNLHKQQTNEGVSRWEERKKLQAIVDRQRVRVQTLESEAEQTQRSNDALRSLVERLERDKALLEVQLRKKTRTANITSTAPLQAEITRLRERLSSSEDACTGLRRQLEHQRRLAEDGTRLRDEVTKLRREIEREKEISLNLQGRNTRLEAANLEISLRLESMRNEMHRGSEDDSVSREELQRSVLVLGQHVRKLQAKLRARGAASSSLDSSMESPHGSEVSARLHSTLKRKASLENELASLRAENTELNARLQQKVAVLVEVRAALQEASLREAALSAEIASLRSLL